MSFFRIRLQEGVASPSKWHILFKKRLNLNHLKANVTSVLYET